MQNMRTLLETTFSPSFLDITDESYQHIGHSGAGQDGHYCVAITASAFHLQSRVKQHQLIYQALSTLIGKNKGIHALKIQIID